MVWMSNTAEDDFGEQIDDTEKERPWKRAYLTVKDSQPRIFCVSQPTMSPMLSLLTLCPMGYSR